MKKLKPKRNTNSFQRKLQILFIIVFIIAGCNKEEELAVSDFIISVDENPAAGMVLGKIEAISSTDCDLTTFRLESQTLDNAFAVNISSGVVSVLDVTLFNYEINPVIEGIVNVSNRCTSKNVAVTINVVDVDEIALNVSDFIITMNERPNYDYIGQIEASSPAECEPITFGIVSQIPDNAFTVNSTSGTLEVLDRSLFDFETNPVIEGVILVTNGCTSKNISVTINLNDVEEVYNGSVQLNTQGEVNIFGGEGYNKITGYLRIGVSNNNSNITDLQPLSTIETVGSLELMKNPLLTSLQGLENLQSITGYTLNIVANGLLNFNGLSGLTEVVDLFRVTNNNSLESFDGLTSLSSVGRLQITDCNNLTTTNGMVALQNVGEIWINNNDLLTSINFSNNLSQLGTLAIEQNQSLIDIDGMNNLTSLFYLKLSYNPQLSNLNAFSNLSSINIFEFVRNTNITDLNLLSNISTIEKLSLVNTYLTNMSVFNNLNTLNSLKLDNNNFITNLDDFSNITSLGTGDLIIKNNDLLENLNALDNAAKTDGKVEISGNNSITHIDGLNQFTNCSELLIKYNQSLESINGFNGLTSVTAHGGAFPNTYEIISIYDNINLIEIGGFTNLETVYGEYEDFNVLHPSFFEIKYNELLSDFCGFNSFFTNLDASSKFTFQTSENAYNPTQNDMENGNCSL